MVTIHLFVRNESVKWNVQILRFAQDENDGTFVMLSVVVAKA